MVVMAVRAMVKAMTRAAVEMGSGGSAGVVDGALERVRQAWRVATMAWVTVALVAVVVVAWVVPVAEALAPAPDRMVKERNHQRAAVPLVQP